MGTVRILGVEIFAVGTWNEREFSAEDLDGIETSFFALGLGGRVPLKLGHGGDDPRGKDDQLALGWVARLFRQGDKLLADVDVPTDVARLIEDGRLRHVSVELLKDVKAGTRVIPWVLDAVALLGTDQPAVGVLRGLDESLAASAKLTRYAHAARASFALLDEPLNYHSMEKSEDMKDDDKNLAAEIARLTKELSGVTAQFTALKKETESARLDAHRRAITDKLEAAVRSGEILPRAREQFKRVNKVDDDTKVIAVTVADVEDFIAANRQPGARREGRIDSFTRGGGDDVPAGTPADEEMSIRVERWFEEHGIDKPQGEDFTRAVKAIFKADSACADRYKAEVLAKVGVRTR